MGEIAMTHWVIPPNGLIEPVPAPEFLSDDIGAIQGGGTMVTLIWMAEQMCVEESTCTVQHVVPLRLKVPMSNVPSIIGKLALCLMHRHDPAITARGPPTKPTLVS